MRSAETLFAPVCVSASPPGSLCPLCFFRSLANYVIGNEINTFYPPGRESIIIGCRINGRETIILDSHILFIMGVIGVTALVLNVPLGYLREGQRKYSLAWFVYVHLSIPVIAYLRIANHVTSWLIPFFILCAIGGQIAGGRVRRHADKEGR